MSRCTRHGVVVTAPRARPAPQHQTVRTTTRGMDKHAPVLGDLLGLGLALRGNTKNWRKTPEHLYLLTIKALQTWNQGAGRYAKFIQ
jgi:hypothetical protein